MSAEVEFYLVAIAAVLLTGVAKGAGSGLAVGVPLMSIIISPMEAAALMLPILCVMDFVGARAFWGQWDRHSLKIVFPGAAVGIGLGTAAFGILSPDSIRFLIGLLAVVFTLNSWMGTTKSDGPAPHSVSKGVFWGGVSGFTSFIAHAGGPPLMMYMVPRRLSKVGFVSTVNLFFMVTNTIKLLPYAWLGQLSGANLGTTLVLAPFAPFGVWIGIWIHGRVEEKTFYRILEVSLLLSGLQLIQAGLEVHF